ncbi:MAG: hypothetical protein JSV44_12710 [Candidatus Zixiibacteriota bacterium]|nr:MAG: hypothetical protein JSV44_12710 [candidate division Zixibacteria bacterium]
MATERSRSKEEIFADMHREMRAWNPQVPESPERLDPVLRILLQLYSHQLERIDKRIDMIWNVATSSVIRALCPESMRWPVPAYTIMRCHPADPVVAVDPHTRFFYKEKREGGQTFFFTAIRTERLLAAEVKHIFLKMGSSLIDLSPVAPGDTMSIAGTPTKFSGGAKEQVYLAVEYGGNPRDFADATLFLTGPTEVLKQLRWGHWYPGSNFGGFHEDSGFCPGLGIGIDDLFTIDGRATDWGGVRSGKNLFKKLENSLTVIPENFAATWEMGPPESELAKLLERKNIKLSSNGGNLYWIRIDLPAGGDKAKLAARFSAYFNCFIAVNKNEQTLFKHSGGSRLLEIELPENLESILKIETVVDSNGREYIPSHEVRQNRDQRVYSLEEREGRLVLWFDFSSGLELPPDSITVTFATTAGLDANGIAAGKITELYENHPGILNAENILPTAGAVPAKTMQQILTEVSSRLRSRDRALSFSEISNWATSFDPRIKQAICQNGVQRTDRGVRRCIVVRVSVSGPEFHSEDELELLRIRLTDFLKSRSSVNTQYSVEITTA